MLAQTKANRSPYILVSIDRDNGERTSIALHQLVALAWIGPKPSPVHQINHKNGQKRDNRAVNLEWVTNRENADHAHRMGLRDGLRALSAAHEAEVKAAPRSLSAQKLALHYGVSVGVIYRIRRSA